MHGDCGELDEDFEVRVQSYDPNLPSYQRLNYTLRKYEKWTQINHFLIILNNLQQD